MPGIHTNSSLTYIKHFHIKPVLPVLCKEAGALRFTLYTGITGLKPQMCSSSHSKLEKATKKHCNAYKGTWQVTHKNAPCAINHSPVNTLVFVIVS